MADVTTEPSTERAAILEQSDEPVEEELLEDELLVEEISIDGMCGVY